MKLYHASDLHLESGRPPDVGPGDPEGTLILAGDVCPVEHIESWLPTLMQFDVRYRRVIWLFGNHEWWSRTKSRDHLFEQTQLICDAFCPNVTVVSCRARIELPDVTLLCATLWSYPGARAAARLYGYARCDLTEIPGLTIPTWREQHLADVRWLRAELSLESDQKRVVVTHFAPMLFNVAASKYEDPAGIGQQAFGADVLPILSRDQVPDAWIFGHTHYQMSAMWHGTLLQSNPRGSAGERAGPGWPWTGVREVELR